MTMRASFGARPLGLGAGLNVHVEPPSRPCLDEANSYHRERCDPAKCVNPFCHRGADARAERAATVDNGEFAEDHRVTFRCGHPGCSARITALNYQSAKALANKRGWVSGRVRLCPLHRGEK